jgi:hypothetical protein
MKRRVLCFLISGLGLSLLASQVLSNSTCLYSITGGSVTFNSPSSGACIVRNDSVSPSGTYTLNWQVTGTSPANSAPCDASVSWNVTGSSSDPGGGSMNHTVVSAISNANVGATGAFSTDDSWSCTAANLGSWSVSGSSKYNGTTYGSSSRGYTVKATCP